MKKFIPIFSLRVKSILLFMLFTSAYTFTYSQVVVVDYGKSYINVSKGNNGGTIEVGDTLEFRCTFVLRCTSGCPAYVDSCAYYDTVKAGMTYINNSLAVLTNEGKTYKTFTDAAGDDCGSRVGSNLRINLGYNNTDAPATAFRRGRIRNTHKPSYFGSTCIMVASYRVRVTAPLNTIINTGGGSITYKPTTSASVQTVQFPYNNTMISVNFGICTNTVGTNAVGAETNGTFGSGRPRNRVPSGSVPANYVYNMFTTGGPQDYFYGIPNNTSTQTNYTTLNTWPKPDNSSPTHRVFTVWDIIGDHTGATNPLLGNPAADTVANPNAGYMLVVNAAYRIDSAFSHRIDNLCPNTYYELSAWFRNVCSKCGCDSNGKGASNSTGPPYYIPTGPGDSSGVAPNLTLRVDGIDYYTTGNMLYTGRWIKKGFTYLTGPTQTSLTMTIRNNAPGGGGNDWAIDDISLATCTPTLTLTPSGGVNVCYGNQVNMYTVVRCFTPNYIYWTWERSTNGGVTWNPTGVSGVGSPTMVAGEWQYTATYPSFLGDSAHHMNMFRVRIASTAANLLNPNCSFTAQNQIVVWVNNCSVVLETDLVDFNGKLQADLANLIWTSTNEKAGVQFEIQRSDDRVNFAAVGQQSGSAAPGMGKTYSFVDPEPVKGTVYYRLKLSEGDKFKYSKIIMLNNRNSEFMIKSVVNPFNNQITFELVTPSSGRATVTLVDNYGRLIKSTSEIVTQGSNVINVNGLESLSQGSYRLRVQMGDYTANKQLVKSN